MHIYAFGSVCRGEIDLGSDIDLLAVTKERDERFDPNVFSIYSYDRVKELWSEGNPFAWHLSLEARLLFSADGRDFLKQLSTPAQYERCIADCEKFLRVFYDAIASISGSAHSIIFDISAIALAVRNIATCFSLGVSGVGNFSRRSALNLGSRSIPVEEEVCQTLEKARLLCTRGHGIALTTEEVHLVASRFGAIQEWMEGLVALAREHGKTDEYTREQKRI
jgi:hypothetical protein